MDARLPNEDAISLRIAKAALPLYITRIKVHPRAIKGLWRRVKWSALVLLLGIYYLVPWLRWDRGPDAPNQAILIDLDGRRGWFFDWSYTGGGIMLGDGPPTSWADASGFVTLTCTPEFGHPFLLGNTTVTCHAIDRFGNTSTCTFTVTITP